MSDGDRQLPPYPAADDAYALFQRGLTLMAGKHWEQAAVSLEKAKRLEPDKSSIREALGRAYFRSGRYGRAASRHLSLAYGMRPDRSDYRHYRDRLRAA